MEPSLQVDIMFTEEAEAKLPSVKYTLPPVRNAIAVPERGDVIKLGGLESFTFTVVGRQWTYSGNGTASLVLLLDLLPQSNSPKSPVLAIVPPPPATRT